MRLTRRRHLGVFAQTPAPTAAKAIVTGDSDLGRLDARLVANAIVSSMTPSWSKALVSIDADQWLLNGDRHFYRHDRSPATCTRRSGP
jgi:hypothetical protein